MPENKEKNNLKIVSSVNQLINILFQLYRNVWVQTPGRALVWSNRACESDTQVG